MGDELLLTQYDFVISRIFNAPKELVFYAWTDPKQIVHWWGPRIITNTITEMDVKPGGSYRIVMHSPDGVEYPIKGVFREVNKPDSLTMTMDCSEHPAHWHDLVKPGRQKDDLNPAGEMFETVTFEDLNGKTKLTVRIHFKSSEILETLQKMGMKEGWSMSFDRLAEHLVKS